jgi:dGTPase
VRRRIEEREALLSPFAYRSAHATRDVEEVPSPVRAAFQRDRDRIIHSNCFRRLKHKSQVLVNPQGDHFTTRMTHVLQVSQVGRTIARALNLNEDLVEAAALAHDVGHTPFGHIGEQVLNERLPSGFTHAAQGVRTLTLLEKHGKGLNLTHAVIDAVRRHSKSEGEFIVPEAVADMSLEAQIVRISDAIAYLAHDLADAERDGTLSKPDVPIEIRDALGDTHSSRLDAMVCDVIDASWSCTGESIAPDEQIWIRMSDEMRNVTTHLRDFMFERVYHPTSLSPEGVRARDAVAVLHDYYSRNTEDIPEWMRVISIEPEYAAADFVSGMTDSFAVVALEQISPGSTQGLYQGRVTLPQPQ